MKTKCFDLNPGVIEKSMYAITLSRDTFGIILDSKMQFETNRMTPYNFSLNTR